MEVVVGSGNESIEVVSMILQCWLSNNDEGCLPMPPLFSKSWRIGSFGVWPLMKGAATVAVGAVILLALRRCLRHRRRCKRVEAASSRVVEITRVDTPTKLKNSKHQMTIIPSPSKPVLAPVLPKTPSPVESVKIDFKTAGDDEVLEEATDSNSQTHGMSDVQDDDGTGICETTPANQLTSPTQNNSMAVVEQDTETSELAFNLTFTEGSDSDDTLLDESGSHSSKEITLNDVHSNNTTATGDQRTVTGSDVEHTKEHNSVDGQSTGVVVSKTVFTIV